MKRTRHTAAWIIRKLKTAQQLIVQRKTVVEVCRVIEGTPPTYHRWRQHYGGMQAEEARRLTQLEKENRSSLAEGFSEGVEAPGISGAGEGDALAAGPAKPSDLAEGNF